MAMTFRPQKLGGTLLWWKFTDDMKMLEPESDSPIKISHSEIDSSPAFDLRYPGGIAPRNLIRLYLVYCMDLRYCTWIDKSDAEYGNLKSVHEHRIENMMFVHEGHLQKTALVSPSGEVVRKEEKWVDLRPKELWVRCAQQPPGEWESLAEHWEPDRWLLERFRFGDDSTQYIIMVDETES